MSSLLNVGLIGLGQIAHSYGSPEEAAPYCHAGGILRSDRVRLAAVVDPAEQARAAFNDRWGAALQSTTGPVRGYSTTPEMLDGQGREGERLDVVGVCVPAPHHFQTVRTLLQSPDCPRSIFLEKPPFCSLQEADEIVAVAKERGVPITVSYSRHWSPHVLKLEELVAGGLIGEVHSVVGYCGGQVLSFASHTTDLICQFACAGSEEYTPRYVTARGVPAETPRPVRPDLAARGYEAEPSLGALFVEFENGVTGMQVGGPGEYGQFYADVFGSKGHVRAGIYIPPAAFDRDGKPLDLAPFVFPPDASVFTVAYEQIAGHLCGGPVPHCTDTNWHHVNEIGFAAIESLHGAGRVALPNVDRTRLILGE